jgi:hypothetical protein
MQQPPDGAVLCSAGIMSGTGNRIKSAPFTLSRSTPHCAAVRKTKYAANDELMIPFR